MREYIYIIVWAVVLMASCSKEYFDSNGYVDVVSNAFPVADIDEEHEWQTVTTVEANIDVSALSGEYVVYIYTTDPTVYDDARLLTTAIVEDSDVSRFALPSAAENTLFALAVPTGEGRSYGSSFTIDNDAAAITFTGQEGNYYAWIDVLTAITPQEYTYVFEKDFPVPGDYDFNDVVLSISLEKVPAGVGENNSSNDIIYIAVTLRAVGCTEQVAGCLRLVGTSSSMLTTTYTCPTEEFFVNSDATNTNYVPVNTKAYRRYFSAHGTAERCIVLFNDAHYAISGVNAETENYGVRPSFNTSKDLGSYAVTEKMVVYAIAFSGSGGYAFKYFNAADNLDPFIVTAYNGAYYETHTYPYKTDEVAHYWRTAVSGDVSTYYTDNYPWALLCPCDFSYPIEGQVIGLKSGSVLGGAYQQGHHSFAEWAVDHTAATDWYNYPLSSLVY